MWCVTLECTISTDACIKRQSIILTKKQQKEFGYSFNKCSNCKQGKDVLKNPLNFINRDVNTLKKLYTSTLKKTKKLIKFKLKERTDDRKTIERRNIIKLYGT